MNKERTMKVSEPKDVPSEIFDVLCTHELLRRMQIPTDNIFFNLIGDAIIVAIRLPDKYPVDIKVGTTSMSVEQFQETLLSAAELWNRTGKTDGRWGFETSSVFVHKVLLMLELHRSGILPL